MYFNMGLFCPSWGTVCIRDHHAQKSYQNKNGGLSVFHHLWLSQGVHPGCKFGYPLKSGDNGQPCAIIFTLGLPEVAAL